MKEEGISHLPPELRDIPVTVAASSSKADGMEIRKLSTKLLSRFDLRIGFGLKYKGNDAGSRTGDIPLGTLLNGFARLVKGLWKALNYLDMD
ncbi:hypothetical protein RYX36_002585 [Vicia faba]